MTFFPLFSFAPAHEVKCLKKDSHRWPVAVHVGRNLGTGMFRRALWLIHSFASNVKHPERQKTLQRSVMVLMNNDSRSVDGLSLEGEVPKVFHSKIQIFQTIAGLVRSKKGSQKLWSVVLHFLTHKPNTNHIFLSNTSMFFHFFAVRKRCVDMLQHKEDIARMSISGIEELQEEFQTPLTCT